MATTKGPLMSMEASGTVGKTLTFASWKGRSYVREWVKPSNPKSSSQSGIRCMMKFLGSAWAALSGAIQATYDAGALSKSISSFNEYMSVNMSRWRDGLVPSQETPAAAANTAATISDLTLTGGAGTATVDVTLSTAANQWGVIVFRDSATITALNRTKAVHVIDVGGETALSFLDSGLAAGTYHYRVAAITDDGVIGTAIADETVVVT